jgi:arginine exporter protein ArgO
MKEKIAVAFSVLLLAVVLLSLAVYFLSGPAADIPVLIPVVALLVVAGAGFMVWRRVKAAKAGLKFKDEMERKISYKAGYYAFIATIYFCLALSWLIEEFPSMGITGFEPRHGPTLVLLFSGLVFVASYIILDRLGPGD